MHRPAFRSALEHTCRSVLIPARPSASSASASASVSVPSRPAAAALFSTTSSQSILKWVPNSKERQAAAASELSSLDSNDAGSAAAAAAAAAAAPAKPAASLLSREAPVARDRSSTTADQIINVRSLPRKTSGPRFAAHGGLGASNADRSASPFRTSAEGGRPPSQFSRENFGGGRFGGAGRRPGDRDRAGDRTGDRAGYRAGDRAGGREAAGGRSRGRRGGNKDKDGESKRAEGLTEEQEQALYMEACEWLHFHEFGQPEAFEPSLSREGLLGYSPAVASSAAAPGGYVSTALRSMRMLAGGNPFAGSFEPGESHTDASPNPEGARNEVHKDNVVFFDTMVERVRTEQALHSNRAIAKLKRANLPAETSLIKAPSDVTKASIMEAAVRGLYEGPSSAATAAGPLLDTTYRYQAKDNTYSSSKAKQFEAKIRELLPKDAAAGKVGLKSQHA